MSKPSPILWMLCGAVGALTSCRTPAPATPLAITTGSTLGDSWSSNALGQRRASALRSQDRKLHGFGMLTSATGDYEFKDDFLGKDESRAFMQRLQLGVMNDEGIGGGIDIKLIVPHNDFYENSINRTELTHFDIYGFVMTDPLTEITDGRFRMPMRVGPYFSGLDAEFTSSGDDTDYASVGIRIELQPEIILTPPSDEFEASLFARLSAGVHATTIDDESTDERYDSTGHSLGLEVGLRMVFGRVSLSSSYIHNRHTIRESDVENGLFIPRLETDFEGVQFSLGVSF